MVSNKPMESPNWHAFNINEFSHSAGTREVFNDEPFVQREFDGTHTVSITARHPWGDVKVTATASGSPDESAKTKAIAGFQVFWRHVLATPGAVEEEWRYDENTRIWTLEGFVRSDIASLDNAAEFLKQADQIGEAL